MASRMEVALDALRQSIDRRFDQVDQRFERVDATAVETRRHFDIVAEGLRAEVRLLAEGFTLRIERLETTLRDELARSHDTLATLMRLRYTDLDRRVTALERRPRDSA